jgi:hypothetical protein
MSNFYCQHLVGYVDFSIDEWNKTYNEIKDMNLTEEERSFILHGPQKGCKEQCFTCMAIVGERRLKTKPL